MPFLQRMSNRASTLFCKDTLPDLEVPVLSQTDSLLELMQSSQIAQSSEECAVIESVPMAIQHALLAVVRYSLEHEDSKDRIQITFSWSPAYEWGFKLWEARSAGSSAKAITIAIEGPYPDD